MSSCPVKRWHEPSLIELAPQDHRVTRVPIGMRSTPPFEDACDVRWVTVNFGEATRDRTCIEVGGVHAVGEEFTREVESHVEQSLPFSAEIRHQVGDVMETLLAISVHVAIDGGLVIVLLNELDHQIAQIPEGIRHISLGTGASVREGVRAVVWSDSEWTGTE